MSITDTASPDARRPLSTLRFSLFLAFGAVLLAVLCALGAWQVERLQWKEGLLAEIDARMHDEPSDFAQIAALFDRGAAIDYRPVALSGHFVHSGERYFLATRKGEPGWDVYTPFILDSRHAVMVNRGFVPDRLRDPALRPDGQIEGEVSITGLVRSAPTDKANMFVPDNAPDKNQFFWRNLADMKKGLDLPATVSLAPFFVDVGAGSPPGGYPIGGATIIDIPNDHLQYAITWFGLAAVLVVMMGVLIIQQRRRMTNA